MTEYKYYDLPYQVMGGLIKLIQENLKYNNIKIKSDNAEVNRFISDYTDAYNKYVLNA